MLHRQSLAAKTVPEEMNKFLKLAIKHNAVNTKLFIALFDELSSAHKTLELFYTEVVEMKYSRAIIPAQG